MAGLFSLKYSLSCYLSRSAVYTCDYLLMQVMDP